MYEQNVLSGHNKVIQAHVQSLATGIEDKGHHVLRAVVGARPDLRIAQTCHLTYFSRKIFDLFFEKNRQIMSNKKQECLDSCRLLDTCSRSSAKS